MAISCSTFFFHVQYEQGMMTHTMRMREINPIHSQPVELIKGETTGSVMLAKPGVFEAELFKKGRKDCVGSAQLTDTEGEVEGLAEGTVVGGAVPFPTLVLDIENEGVAEAVIVVVAVVLIEAEGVLVLLGGLPHEGDMEPEGVTVALMVEVEVTLALPLALALAVALVVGTELGFTLIVGVELGEGTSEGTK